MITVLRDGEVVRTRGVLKNGDITLGIEQPIMADMPMELRDRAIALADKYSLRVVAGTRSGEDDAKYPHLRIGIDSWEEIMLCSTYSTPVDMRTAERYLTCLEDFYSRNTKE